MHSSSRPTVSVWVVPPPIKPQSLHKEKIFILISSTPITVRPWYLPALLYGSLTLVTALSSTSLTRFRLEDHKITPWLLALDPLRTNVLQGPTRVTQIHWGPRPALSIIRSCPGFALVRDCLFKFAAGQLISRSSPYPPPGDPLGGSVLCILEIRPQAPATHQSWQVGRTPSVLHPYLYLQKNTDMHAPLYLSFIHICIF